METEQELIDRFEHLENLKKTLELDLEDLKKELINLSKEKNKNVFKGARKILSLKQYEKIIYPENKELLEKILKKNDEFDKVCGIIYPRLSSKILKGELSQETLNLVKKEKAFRFVLLDKN